ncbi:c-type cytochrome domain-containing protein [Zhouia amylolytica]|uniref:c-type cytochrome domain-containing protein n=1 Tax=Zhouia amylolytica TaxID=376730 RepID=UPI0020CEE2DB|nr:c-type cytochrome domain-containing protein [Zhouia amylolytica]MCQ0112508.1 hypothetical protein [Zhouia amylolytica]
MTHFLTFLGRLHPLIVHLPIGFILLGLLLQWYNRKQDMHLDKAISIAFLWAGISAVAACITGLLLYTHEGFAYDTVKLHLWFGIITAVCSFIYYVRIRQIAFHKTPVIIFSILILIVISATGHFGGNITHGSDYLTEPLPPSVKRIIGIETQEGNEIALNEEELDDAILYSDIIQPILDNKCVSCHGPKKSKGELALHTPEAIQKGGENGAVIDLKTPDSSAIYHRLILPVDHEDHMPPKEKTPLTKDEIALIKVWIEHEAHFDKSIGQLQLDHELFTSFFKNEDSSELPPVSVATVSKEVISNLKKSTAFGIQPVSKSTSFLEVSCLNFPDFKDADLNTLKPLFKNIVSINLRGTQVSDDIFNSLIKLPNLQTLKLDNTQVSGAGIGSLQKLEYLRTISVTNTNFEAASLKDLALLKTLEKVYIFNTPAAQSPQENTDKTFTINYGNYTLPIIATDTIIY